MPSVQHLQRSSLFLLGRQRKDLQHWSLLARGPERKSRELRSLATDVNSTCSAAEQGTRPRAYIQQCERLTTPRRFSGTSPKLDVWTRLKSAGSVVAA